MHTEEGNLLKRPAGGKDAAALSLGPRRSQARPWPLPSVRPAPGFAPGTDRAGTAARRGPIAPLTPGEEAPLTCAGSQEGLFWRRREKDKTGRPEAGNLTPQGGNGTLLFI